MDITSRAGRCGTVFCLLALAIGACSPTDPEEPPVEPVVDEPRDPVEDPIDEPSDEYLSPTRHRAGSTTS